MARLEELLIVQALEHDSPLALLRTAALELRELQLLRPALSTLERLVAAARARAERETHERLAAVLDAETRRTLDGLCVTDVRLGVSRLVWLGREATSASPSQIVEQLSKLAFLRELGAERWLLEAVPANRRRQLAALARRSSTAALAGRPDRLRYSALLCFCQEQLTRLVDEVLGRSDQAIGEAHGRARRELEQLKTETATAANEKVALFDLLVGLLLDESIADDELRQRAWPATRAVGGRARAGPPDPAPDRRQPLRTARRTVCAPAALRPAGAGRAALPRRPRRTAAAGRYRVAGRTQRHRPACPARHRTDRLRARPLASARG